MKIPMVGGPEQLPDRTEADHIGVPVNGAERYAPGDDLHWYKLGVVDGAVAYVYVSTGPEPPES